jgi:dienelactone hydrolase
LFALASALAVSASAQSVSGLRSLTTAKTLPGTKPLEMQGDLAAQMVAGINRYLTRETEASVEKREEFWKRDFASAQAYGKSVEPNRAHLRKYLGVIDPRVSPVELELIASPTTPALVGETRKYRVLAVRWPVLKGVDAEGLLLEPKGKVVANVVAVPDCDWTPEMVAGLVPGVPAEGQFARRLAENGCRVLVPALIDRKDTYSGHPAVRMTNQPHREFIYRGAYEMGRHIIGYEVQKVLAAVDWFSAQDKAAPVGVYGYGEGGLLAFYSAALDERIQSTTVSGYFGPREEVYREPIYRNVWALLEEFGDAEIASLIAPRGLVVEYCFYPTVSGPPDPRDGRSGAAPGVLGTPAQAAVAGEVSRARALVAKLEPEWKLPLVENAGAYPGADAALTPFLRALDPTVKLVPTASPAKDLRAGFNPDARLKRQFDQLNEFTQNAMREGEFRRAELWKKADGSSVEKWRESTRQYRAQLWDEVIGRLPAGIGPANPRTRLVYDEPTYTGYEVVLDLWPDVYSYGILLLPKGLKRGERRPVVVCQHGLEGRPQDVADPKINNPAYNQFAVRLAERGFVTFSPQNPYIGKDDFRVLQRKANPLKKSLFSVIVRQHERILDWLSTQSYVDPERIGFYGLSYGGKTAMRVPALLERYALSICSADYNEWIWKNVSSRSRLSYMFTGEYEMYEFDLGNTFNYAEMAWLICPRPFMVERGHDDGVSVDEWVAYEYARAQQRYDRLGIGDRTTIEFFNGPHTIHGVGTYDFLHKHLKWPKPAAAAAAK